MGPLGRSFFRVTAQMQPAEDRAEGVEKVEKEERDDDEKGGEENAGEETDIGFRPICRLAWSGSRLAVARFTQLQVYCKASSLAGVGSGPLLPNGTSSVALINTLEWSEGTALAYSLLHYKRLN